MHAFARCSRETLRFPRWTAERPHAHRRKLRRASEEQLETDLGLLRPRDRANLHALDMLLLSDDDVLSSLFVGKGFEIHSTVQGFKLRILVDQNCAQLAGDRGDQRIGQREAELCFEPRCVQEGWLVVLPDDLGRQFLEKRQATVRHVLTSLLSADIVHFEEGDPRQIDLLRPQEGFHPIGTVLIFEERKKSRCIQKERPTIHAADPLGAAGEGAPGVALLWPSREGRQQDLPARGSHG